MINRYIRLCALFILFGFSATIMGMSAVKVRPPQAQTPVHALNLLAKKHLTLNNYIQLLIVSYQLRMLTQMCTEFMQKLFPAQKYIRRRDEKLAADLHHLKLQNSEISDILKLPLVSDPNLRLTDLTTMLQDYVETEGRLKIQAMLDKQDYLYYQSLPRAIGRALPFLTAASIVPLIVTKEILHIADQDEGSDTTPPDPDKPELPKISSAIIRLHFLMVALGIANSFVHQ